MLDQCAVTSVHAHAPADDDVEAVLEGAVLDEGRAGLDGDLVRRRGDRGKRAPGDAREQVDAVESGHSLDDEHQAGVPGATLCGPTPAKESLGTGRVYAAAGEAAASGHLCEHVFA